LTTGADSFKRVLGGGSTNPGCLHHVPERHGSKSPRSAILIRDPQLLLNMAQVACDIPRRTPCLNHPLDRGNVRAQRGSIGNWILLQVHSENPIQLRLDGLTAINPVTGVSSGHLSTFR